MSSLKIWARVPDGSTLSLWVTPTSGSCIAAARLRRDDGTEQQWLSSQLIPGPKTTTVRSPRDYVVTVRIEFTGAGENAAEVHAKVGKPDGTTHGSEYQYDVAGGKGDDARSTIVIQTANS